jgi:AcrR family transcriptional regulator
MTDVIEIFEDAPVEDVRHRILAAATSLIAAGGRDAATTRAVAIAAAVQPPTIYRLFGDKRGLLDAAAEEGLAAYIAKKSAEPIHPDPVEAIRNGWDMHIAFGLAHPGLFAIMSADLRPQQLSPAASKGQEILRLRVNEVALAGRLRVSQQRGLEMLQSACNGTVLTQLPLRRLK